MATYSPKYSIGSKAYYIIHSTLEIVPVVIIRLHLDSPNANEPISYKVQKSIPNNYGVYQTIDFINESALLDFPIAKSSLLAWLIYQHDRINNLSEPLV